MVVWGAEDKILPAAHAYEAGRAAPDAVVRVFDQCGHWPHMERASEFNADVIGFLTE